MMIRGRTNKEMAKELELTEGTILRMRFRQKLTNLSLSGNQELNQLKIAILKKRLMNT
jgi:DNA-binding NarL/FixJ family response regulator